MKTRHAKKVPAGDNKNCTCCKKILMDGEQAYFMNRDSLGRGNHKCITCFNGRSKYNDI